MRHGGDEFIIILPDIASAQDAGNVSEKIRHEMSIPYVVEGMELISSASIGISLYPDDAGDVTSLLKNSDAAMYRAKAHGRNTYRFFTWWATRRWKFGVGWGQHLALPVREYRHHRQHPDAYPVDLLKGRGDGLHQRGSTIVTPAGGGSKCRGLSVNSTSASATPVCSAMSAS
jgi:hypothetical protein